MLAELHEVLRLHVEVYLVDQHLLQRVSGDRDFKERRECRQDPAHQKYYIDVPLDVLLNPGMPNFDCHLLPLQHRFVHLAYRSGPDGLPIKGIEYLIDGLPVLL